MGMAASNTPRAWALRAGLALAIVPGCMPGVRAQTSPAEQSDWIPTAHVSWTQFLGAVVEGDGDRDAKLAAS
jgi:hypothetical protein